MDLMLLMPIGAAAALLFAFVQAKQVLAEDEGTDLMKKIAAAIVQGLVRYVKET